MTKLEYTVLTAKIARDMTEEFHSIPAYLKRILSQIEVEAALGHSEITEYFILVREDKRKLLLGQLHNLGFKVTKNNRKWYNPDSWLNEEVYTISW